MSKDWTGTSESIFKQLGASDHSKDEREENDYYATDPRAIDDLLKKESLDHNIWECASGGGHLVNRLREHGFNVYSTDLVDRGCQDDIIDFLKCEKTFDGDILTNPPYKYCTEFILKALSLVNEGNKVVMFLKLTTLEGGERYRELYSKYPPQYIYIVKEYNVLNVEISKAVVPYAMLGLYGKKDLKKNHKLIGFTTNSCYN